MSKSTKKILALLVLMARQAGLSEADIRQAWKKTTEAPLPQLPIRAPAVPEAPRPPVKTGLDALFDKPQLPPVRHKCHSCGKILINRKKECQCPECAVPMLASAITPHGHGGRKRKP